jgi:hypothetical protein
MKRHYQEKCGVHCSIVYVVGETDGFYMRLQILVKLVTEEIRFTDLYFLFETGKEWA